jgi:hypothetical protein
MTSVINPATITNESLNLIPQTWSWKQPDITYHPDRQKWAERTAKRLGENASLPRTALPEGFPTKLSSPLVWEGKDWKGEEQWVYELTATHLDEISAAVKHFHGMWIALCSRLRLAI